MGEEFEALDSAPLAAGLGGIAEALQVRFWHYPDLPGVVETEK